MDNFFGSLKNYGLVEGLSVYLKMKNRQRDKIIVPKLRTEVHLRPHSTDRCVFKQIFLKQDLNIPVFDRIKVETAIDLGANIGISSLYLANKFPDAKIVGVEPDAANSEMFKKNLEQYPNVDFLLGAVRGDQQKVKLVDVGKGESGYMAMESEDGLLALTIGEIMAKYDWDQVDFIKMDIEGSEKSVFEQNYEAWLPKTKVLMVELHEQKAPGCSKALDDALAHYNFKRSKSGEYEVLINLDLI